LACAFAASVSPARVGGHLFANVGLFAWLFALLGWLVLLRMFDRDASSAIPAWVTTAGHAGFATLVCVVAAQELAWVGREYVDARSVWPIVPWGAVPAIGLLLIGSLWPRESWPFASHRNDYRTVAGSVLVAWMLVFALIANLGSDGNSAPLPYVPLGNPLDLSMALIVAAIALWIVRLARDGIDVQRSMPREILYGIPSTLIFIWANAIVLRSIHHLYAVPWRFDALWHSTIAQAALSLLWTVIALAAMVWANRRGARAGWVAGAALLSVVVVKLFVIDLSHVGGVERIVSFIGVGLLLLLIGYLAPVPPARKENAP
jgi:uncharacterized membrane protein